jgi:hypothetical protein
MTSPFFFITNSFLFKDGIEGYTHLSLNNNCDFYYRGEVHKFDNISILVMGHTTHRVSDSAGASSLSQPNFIYESYKKYGIKFTEHIKGIFIIVIINENRIDLFTDHFGLKSIYIYQKDSEFIISDNVNIALKLNAKIALDPVSIGVKALLNMVPSVHTIYNNIRKSSTGAHVILTPETFKVEQYWSVGKLSKSSFLQNHADFSLSDFADLVQRNFSSFLSFHQTDQHAITLTGGKDSRTGLAALRSNGVTPVGFTYGHPMSRDAIYARKLADALSLPHHIYSPPDNEEYFEKIACEIAEFGNPAISLHRAHRLYAFKEMATLFEGKTAYYAGYMAGEFLMGVYYDNLVFTKYLTDFWDKSILQAEAPLLEYHFLRPSLVSPADINERLSELQTFNPSLSVKERQFYGMFEIGVPHHSQDIFLAGKYFDVVFPFFIDIDFLEALFQSRFNFLYTDNKTRNLIERYKLFEFNLNIQHLLCPEMDNIPFGKRGSYTTGEFLRGKYYWAAIKSIRYVLQRQKYPVTYAYGIPFREFLYKNLVALNSETNHALHTSYDIPKAISALQSFSGNSGEALMRRYSDIVMLYLQMKGFQ